MVAHRDQAAAQVPGQEARTPGRGPPGQLARGWAAVISAAVTLLVTLYKLGRPSLTRDEGATLLAVHRTFPQLLRMLGNDDVVHSAYYSLIWPVARLAGSGTLAVRLPSALAMAAAAGAVALLGTRLVSGLAGLASGLVFAVLPPVSWYAEQAREYAIVTALAAFASYLLIRAFGGVRGVATPRQHSGTGRGCAGWWATVWRFRRWDCSTCLAS